MKMVVVDALEDCLKRLQAGANLDQVLALYPQWAEEMRPLLESALLAWSLRSIAPVPQASMARSRALFVEKVAAQSRLKPHGLVYLGIRFKHSFFAILSAVIILTVGTTFVSAMSLPGDIFYPVKLASEQTRLLFTTNTNQRLILQERFDKTRADEVENVLSDHRILEVTFVGLLTRSLDEHWQVAGVNVEFPADLNSAFTQMVNAYVEVTGQSQNDGTVQVSEIHLRELSFSGKVTSMTLEMVYIDRIGVVIEDTTKVTGMVSVGAYVSVNAYRQEDGTLIARQIVVRDPAKQEVLQASATDTAAESQVQSPGGNNPTSTMDDINPASGDNTRVADTATSQPTSTTGATSIGAGNQGNTPTEPADTASATSTATPTARIHTRTPMPTRTPTPTQNWDGSTRPPENGGSQRSPTPTPTPGHNGPDQGD